MLVRITIILALVTILMCGSPYATERRVIDFKGVTIEVDRNTGNAKITDHDMGETFTMDKDGKISDIRKTNERDDRIQNRATDRPEREREWWRNDWVRSDFPGTVSIGKHFGVFGGIDMNTLKGKKPETGNTIGVFLRWDWDTAQGKPPKHHRH